MRSSSTFLATLAACLAQARAEAGEILNIGDLAPPLAVSRWVKGERSERFDPGTIYVVEFWATWCAPCRASIPHLTELARQYKDKGVRFIGVAVLEQDARRVKPFVDAMRDAMDYGVALDAVPADGDPNDGAMARSWVTAAEEGIPSAFVVRDGKISWIGHPMKLDEPLARIVAGDWDPSEVAGERLVMKTRARRLRLLREKGKGIRDKVFPLYEAGRYKAALTALDEETRGDSELAEGFAWLKFAALCNCGDVEPGLELGARLLEANKDDAQALNHCFCKVISPKYRDEPDPRVAQLVLRAALRAVELSRGEEAGYLDTLAEAQLRTGDAAGAVATSEKALKRVEEEIKDPSDPHLKLFRDHLERFRRAASAKVAHP